MAWGLTCHEQIRDYLFLIQCSGDVEEVKESGTQETKKSDDGKDFYTTY